MTQKVLILVIIVLTLTALTRTTNGANILAVFPSSSPSHLIIEMAVVGALVERQHNVTVVTVLPLKHFMVDPSVTHIHLNLSLDVMSHAVRSSVNVKGFNKFGAMYSSVRSLSQGVSDILYDQKLLNLLHNADNKFDLVLFGYIFSDFLNGIAAHFQCPIALIWVNQPMPYILQQIGNPFETAYVPMPFTNNEHLNFKYRLLNVFVTGVEQIMMAILNTWMKTVYDLHFPADKYPTYAEMKQQVALVLFCHHFSEKPVRSLVPGLVEIGGIQLNEQPNELPQDIAAFLNSASQHGVIFFSLGTNVRKEYLQSDTLQIIFNVLSKLPQKVLWKCDNEHEVPGNSSNILYKNWLPQADILAHPNIRLFFNHGGKGGNTEAQFYGVPMIGMPIFGDQPTNVADVVSKGYGIAIESFQAVTEESLKSAVVEVLENPKYKLAIQQFSKVYRDRPMSAKKSAVYWLEYVIRHQGAAHMQSPLKRLSFVQKHNLDIILALFVLFYLVVKISKMAFSLMKKILLIYSIEKKKFKSN